MAAQGAPLRKSQVEALLTAVAAAGSLDDPRAEVMALRAALVVPLGHLVGHTPTHDDGPADRWQELLDAAAGEASWTPAFVADLRSAEPDRAIPVLDDLVRQLNERRTLR